MRIRRADGWPLIALAYTAVAVVWTWPLARHLGTRLAGDVGDPAFNCWVLAWTAGQVLAALGGHIGALGQYWQGNIFWPEPLALTYSEHLTGQMLQVLPVYAATGNIITAYNALFIATFALSGLAMYLFVRDLTGEPAAAFLAGLAFAYAPYRLGQFSHLQVLSSYWMPLALFGLRRYFARAGDRSGVRPLAGGAAALVMQHLSCGYYMLFFAPFVAAYAAYEMVQRRLLRQWRVWAGLAIAAAAIALLTWPFVRPYFQVRQHTNLGVRSPEEIRMFSADTHAFGTIAPNSRNLAERLSGYPHAEGEGFSGFTILAFAGVGIVWAVVRLVRSVPWRSIPEWQVLAIATSGALLAGSIAVLVWYFVHGHLTLSFFGSHAVRQNASQPLTIAAWSFVVFASVTAIARRHAGPSATAAGFFVVAVALAALFALGPRMQALGRDLGAGPYGWLLSLPGFDGLRVPARFLMLVALFLAVLAGIGAAALLASRLRLAAYVAIAAGAIGILAESWVAPLQTNQPVIPAAGFTVPPPPASGRAVNPIYRFIKDLPDPVLLAELPFGEPAYEVIAVFNAGYHRRPLLNGYSGFFPRSYLDRAGVLHQLPDRADAAERLLREANVTHVLVHEAAFLDDRGQQISAWLLAIGARPVTSHERDRLFSLH